MRKMIMAVFLSVLFVVGCGRGVQQTSSVVTPQREVSREEFCRELTIENSSQSYLQLWAWTERRAIAHALDLLQEGNQTEAVMVLEEAQNNVGALMEEFNVWWEDERAHEISECCNIRGPVFRRLAQDFFPNRDFDEGACEYSFPDQPIEDISVPPIPEMLVNNNGGRWCGEGALPGHQELWGPENCADGACRAGCVTFDRMPTQHEWETAYRLSILQVQSFMAHRDFEGSISE